MEYMIKNYKLVKKDPLSIPARKGLVYEVVRVINNSPLFFQDHFERLLNSLKAAGSKIVIAFEDYKKANDDLISSTKKSNFNLKTIIDPATGDLFIFESPSSYPEDKLYRKGIKTTILKYERNNPNAKIVNTDLTTIAAKIMEATGSYEVILEDSQGRLTEGSRSNIFFIKDEALYTSPVSNVLPGITRLKIMETMEEMGIKVYEEEIKRSDLEKFTGAFMSGTSPKILPIKSIEEVNYEVYGNEFINRLIEGFNEKIEKDLEEYRNL